MEKNKKQKSKRKTTIFLIIAIIIVGVFIKISYVFLTGEHQNTDAYVDKDDDNNTAYTILENTDTINLQSIILTTQQVTIYDISKHFYGETFYWPFILQVNDIQKIPDPLNINSDQVIKIPRIDFLRMKEDKGAADAKVLKDIMLTKIAEKNKVEPPVLDMGGKEGLKKWEPLQ